MVFPFSTAGKHPFADLDQVIHAPARLMVISYLYVVESVDYVYLVNLTGLTWGNLATHLNKLEEAGYVEIIKSFKGKKPHSAIRLTDAGRSSFEDYITLMQCVINNIAE